MKNLNKYMDFIKAAEGLKSVTRTAWSSTGRRESTAEHSWRLALLAAVFLEEFSQLDKYKVILMALIHDMGEIYTGDISANSVFSSKEKEEAERRDIQEVFRMLPDRHRDFYISLWEEYESGVTPEARFVKAFDKGETILQHIQGKNPEGFDYKFNLSYGKKYFQGDEKLEEIREFLDEETKEKIRGRISNGK
ncbi:MAG: HD domain-containing protein [Clostridiales bacterium]|nr:HD domain-containing protein [Clostridiales bacterium]